MAKQILLPTAVKTELANAFKIDRMTLDRALKYTINSPRSIMIREAAIQRGGRVFTGQMCDAEATHAIELFRETCPRRLDQSCAFHDACDMSCRHGRAFQSRLLIRK